MFYLMRTHPFHRHQSNISLITSFLSWYHYPWTNSRNGVVYWYNAKGYWEEQSRLKYLNHRIYVYDMISPSREVCYDTIYLLLLKIIYSNSNFKYCCYIFIAIAIIPSCLGKWLFFFFRKFFSAFRNLQSLTFYMLYLDGPLATETGPASISSRADSATAASGDQGRSPAGASSGSTTVSL